MYTEIVIQCIEEVVEKFHQKIVIFLNESDLESSLSNSLRSKLPPSITVNTQTPWYDEIVTQSTFIIDITAFDKSKFYLSYNPALKKKGYKYDDEAVAMELKYFRYNADINEIQGDFYKMSILVKSPKNECFIVAGARTNEIFLLAQTFMINQLNQYRNDYQGNVKIYLFGPENYIEIV